jgi:beta-N-acetylhexosaminidase
MHDVGRALQTGSWLRFARDRIWLSLMVTLRHGSRSTLRTAHRALHAAAIICLCRAACAGSVSTQLDQLVAEAAGRRIGMITNPSGCDEAGNLDASYLIAAPGTTITAFFAPEHGLRGTLPPGVPGGDYIDPDTSVPVYAIYGIRSAPTDAQMATVDLLVFDMQDVGARFYTFVWTMTLCMESAARNAKPFYVIDRPNPIGGRMVQGVPNTLDYGLVGRLGPGEPFGVATRHGMTAGEIALMWNGESMAPKCDLHVIPVPGWTRGQWWDDLGRVFVKPSPNMRTPATAAVYPGTCIFEGSNLSEGRGTSAPFEMIGAPFVDGAAWAAALNARHLPGVQFDSVTFTPASNRWSGQQCGGVRVTVTDREVHDPVRTGLHMMRTVWLLYSSQVAITSYASTLMGVPNLHNRIKTEEVEPMVLDWLPALTAFKQVRAQYLIYPDTPTAAADWWLMD